MAHALIIGEAEREQIAELKAIAAATPRDVHGVQAAADQNMAAFRDEAHTMTVSLPVGFAVTYTQEVQPNAPPPGLCHHISVSVSSPYRLPNPAAVEMILEEFGTRPIAESHGVWIERLEEERKALGSDIKDIYAEAKSAGFDVKVLRELVRIRKQEAAEVEEQETLLDIYRRALGM